ncbi:YjbQ family protein [Candidatus Peregrinibacteria bacterium]|nr:YjbQ family protein [Candidatus Peregrinibacteria bacterium]
MRSFTQYLWFNTKHHREYINITPDVAVLVQESGIQEGLCLVSAMHITASVYVNDAEEGLIADLDELLEDLAPSNKDYRHNHTSDPNGDAHLKRMIMGQQVVLPITQGKLDLGTWEQDHYAEFDGQRKKRVIVKIIGE